jgi:tRNA(Ile)-lysidine synthase
MAGSRFLTSLSSEVLQSIEPHLPNAPLAVALSGGADSAVCAWAAGQLAPSVRAIHVDHAWPASPSLRAAAREVAAKLNVDLTVIEAQVPEGPSPEGQARTVRYRALEGEIQPGELLLTGHTADDQAETVVGNLLRGAGSAGLAGIPAQRRNLIRPMLGVSRSQTRELATLLGLPWMDDPSNLDTALRRNALRRDIIPFLENRMNPELRAALVRMAESLRADERWLDDIASSVPLQAEGQQTVRFPAPLLVTLPVPVAARVVRRAIRPLFGGYPGSSDDLATVLDVARGGPPGQLGGSLRVERRGVWVVIDGAGPAEELAVATWSVPGSLLVGGWTFEAWIEEVPPTAFPLSHFAEVFDADTVPDEFTVRSSRGEERIAMVGGSKPVAEALAEAGVPQSSRPRWPVVAWGSDVLWVPGARRADAGWVGTGTSRYLWVRATVEGNR